jgi:hypothetical protein
MSLDDGAVDQCIFEIGTAAYLSENKLENSGFSPSSETPEHAVQIAECLWQITPRQPRTHQP